MPERHPKESRDQQGLSLLGELSQWLLNYRPPQEPSYWLQDRDKILDVSPEHLDRLFDIIRSEVKREDDLIDQRNTWCILFSAGIFAAIGALKVAEMSGTTPVKIAAMLLGIALIGAAARVSLQCGRAVTAARMQIEYLFSFYMRNREKFEKLGLPRPFGRRSGHERAVGYSQITPLVTFYLWVMIGLLWIAMSAIELSSAKSPAVGPSVSVQAYDNVAPTTTHA